ncbi:MAG TPA: acyltransferase [Chitinophagales bacterium]|nr:acyltransferase [Bacteroidota bacterium]HNA58406.1 acyltransferase [Chitinophagales bacterium]
MPTIYPLARIIGRDHIGFGDPVIIDDFVFIYAKVPMQIGNYVHFAAFTSVIGVKEIKIGNFVALSHGVRLLTASDDFKDWGFGNSTVPFEYRNVRSGSIQINNFCIIGANSVVLPGVTIGEGATVGACSVVTRDLEPWGVYIGNRKVSERNRIGVFANYAKFQQSFGCR